MKENNMWTEKILLDNAMELSFDCLHSEVSAKTRWTDVTWYVVNYDKSPTKYASFTLEIPRNSDQGLRDVNFKEEIELQAVQQIEVTKMEWQVVK